ncbi:Transmembrane protein [Entamoeba marina]
MKAVHTIDYTQEMKSESIKRLIQCDKSYNAEPGKYFLSLKGTFKVVTNLLISMMVGLTAFRIHVFVLGFDDDDFGYFNFDELTTSMQVIGAVYGLCNGCFQFYFDRLFVPYFDVVDSDEKKKKVFTKTLLQSVMVLIVDFFLFLFSVVAVKFYQFILRGFGTHLETKPLPLDIDYLWTYLLFSVLFVLMSRFSLNLLKYKMSIQLP